MRNPAKILKSEMASAGSNPATSVLTLEKTMKLNSEHHHVKRLASRMMEAEICENREDAKKIIEKAEKHQKKLSIWHRIKSLLNF